MEQQKQVEAAPVVNLNWLVIDTPLVRLFASPAWRVIKHRFPAESDLALLERIVNQAALDLADLEVEVK
jgi:hypothetical protein